MDKNKKVNILFLAHDSSLSGASLSLLSLLSNINRDIFNAYVIVPYKGVLKDEIERLGIPVYVKQLKLWIPFSLKWGLNDLIDFVLTLRSRIWAISRLIEKNDIDIVYTNTVTIIDGAIAASITNTPHIWHGREYINGNKDIKPYIPTIFLPAIMNKFSDQIIVNSNSLKSFITSKLYQSTISTIYNGVNITDYSRHNFSNKIKSELRIPESFKIVGCVGCLSERKDILTFIRSAEIIKQSVDNVAFIIVGDGNNAYKEKLINLINNLELNQNIFLLGQRKDIPDIMNAIDILVLPSEQEAFGKVIIEAMAAGKPVVATKSGGPEEIIIDGKTGYLVSIKDHKSIAEKVTLLLSNSEKATLMGETGFNRAKQLYSMENYVKSIESIIFETAKKQNKPNYEAT